MDKMMLVSLVVTGIGALFIALSGISYRFRAFTNKRAWNGQTVPLMIIGLIFLIPGLIMIYFNYPK